MHKNIHYKKIIIDIFAVTFRMEGVDWNAAYVSGKKLWHVTFRKEGVDWNHFDGLEISEITTSPSARKVWIEITKGMCFVGEVEVTFRKEGVDWNKMSFLQ